MISAAIKAASPGGLWWIRPPSPHRWIPSHCAGNWDRSPCWCFKVSKGMALGGCNVLQLSARRTQRLDSLTGDPALPRAMKPSDWKPWGNAAQA